MDASNEPSPPAPDLPREPQKERGGLIHAIVLDGRGGASALGFDQIDDWSPEDGTLWIHLDYWCADSVAWLRERSGIDAIHVESLLYAESRPRIVHLPGAMLLSLRGVNLNPRAEPEDMVGMRIWVDDARIVSVRHRRVMALQDLLRALEQGIGPCTQGELITGILYHVVARMAQVVDDLDDSVGELEDQVLTAESGELRSELASLRHRIIALRRYLSPQREALSRLVADPGRWFDERDRLRLAETYDRLLRYVEDLEGARDRAAVTQEELNSRLSDRMNQTMYILTIVATIFLPPSLLTGLLGVNVGGIPGVDEPAGFAIVCGLILAMCGFEAWLLRRLEWI